VNDRSIGPESGPWADRDGSSERGRRPSGDEPSRRGSTARRYGVEERKRLLAELEQSGETVADFCARVGVSTATICAWKRGLRAHGEAGLVPREPRRNPSGKSGRTRSPEERRRAIETFERSGMTVDAFARSFGVSPWTLRCWIQRYRKDGPKGLEPRMRGRRRGTGGFERVPAAVREEIARTKTRFPQFGLKKVRDFLRRFQGVSVSTGTVARTLEERGIESAAAPRKRRRKMARPRRFERSRPGELWQSDITSFVLSRSGTRVYLVVFLDDFSRYVVSFGLHLQMRSAHVCEVLLEGIARYGKPREVLTDQGPQYFTWRGKSGFQKLLLREGIDHVVARSHHPQTVGKCERLWETIGQEFWERARPADLADARARLAHFLAHYNFFRPHQGIEGAVPADRFFGAEEALRKTIESQLTKRELEAALEELPRKAVYLFGQIGDEQVSVVGERGELLVQTSSGVRQRMGLDELGAPSAAQKEKQDGSADAERAEHDDGRSGETSAADEQETAEVRPAAALPARSEGAVEERHQPGAGAGAPSLHADPGSVAWQEASRGSGGRALDPWAASVAAQSAGPLGDARGTPASAAAAAAQRGAEHAREGRRSAQAEEALGGEGQTALRSGGPDQALDEHPRAQGRDVGERGADAGDENASSESVAQG
jgi:transposase InsO family protein